MPRRSLWKGSFLDAFLLKMKKKSGRLSNKKIYSRRSTILPEFVDSTVQIYNGHAWIRCKITEGKVGHKFGEFALTRKRRPSSRTNTGKQKNVGSQKKPNVGSQKRSMSTFCGHRDGSSVSTTVHNSAVLLPWMQLRTRGIQTLPSFAPWNKSLQLGNSPRYLHGEAGPRRVFGNSSPYFKDFCPDGDGLVCVDTSHATMGICRSLVCRAIRQDCAQLDVFPGTSIHSDGIGATSAASLSPLEGTESKVTADVGGSLVDQCGTFLVTRVMSMMPKLLQIY